MTDDSPSQKTEVFASVGPFAWQRDNAVGATSVAVDAGAKLSDFEILGEIGRGGMGTVFLARQCSTDRQVAVKVLSATMGLQAGCRERFQREIHALSSISNPHIVPIFAAGEDGGQLFFAMELIQGLPLDQHVLQNRLLPKQILQLFLKVCEGVAAAHRAGIIHRDLKPSNVLVAADGTPKIVDLGLAKLVDETAESVATKTVTSAYLGTPAFMAPEQCGGGRSMVDTRTDIYSLGAVLYLLLLGTLPYPVPDDVLVAIENIRTRLPTRPRKLLPGFPIDVETILLKALAKDPDQRYGDVAELIADIASVLSFRPIKARQPSALYVTGRFVRRNWRLVSLTALWLALMTVVLAMAFVGVEQARRRAVAERDAAIQARHGEAEARQAQAREAYYNTISIVQHKIQAGRLSEADDLLRQTPTEARGWEWGYLMRRAKPEVASWQFAGPIARIVPGNAGKDLAIQHGRYLSWMGLATGQAQTTELPDDFDSMTINPADLTAVGRRREGAIFILATGREGTQDLENKLHAVLAAAPGTLVARSPARFVFDASGIALGVGQNAAVTVLSWPQLVSLRTEPLITPDALLIDLATTGTGQLAWIEAAAGQRLIVSEPPRHIAINKERQIPDTGRVLAFRTDGRFLAVGTDSRMVFADTKYGHYSPRAEGGGLTMLAFSPDGNWLASDIGGAVSVWPVTFQDADGEPKLGEEVFRLADFGLSALAFTADSQCLLIGNKQGQVRSYAIAHPATGQPRLASSLASVAANGTWLSLGETVELGKLSDLTSADLAVRPNRPPTAVFGLAADGGTLAIAAKGSPVVEIYSLPSLDCRCIALPCAKPVAEVLLSNSGQTLLLVDVDGHVAAVNTSTGETAMLVAEKVSPPYAISACGDSALFGCAGSSVQVADLGGGQRSQAIDLPGVLAAAYSPSGNQLALARASDVVVWDLSSARHVGILQPLRFAGSANALVFSPDGKRLAIGEPDGVSIWDPNTGRRLASGLGANAPPVQVAFLDDGSLSIIGPGGIFHRLEVVPKVETNARQN